MEVLAEILIVVVQLLVEVLLQFLVYGGFDLAATALSRQRSGPGFILIVVFLVLGAVVGGLANWLHPQPFLPHLWMRVANLLIAPPAVGGLSWLIASWRQQLGAGTSPSLHFWLAFAFVLAFDLIRLMVVG